MCVNKNCVKFVVLFLFLFVSKSAVFATSSSYSSTFSFGGKILMDKIPGVTCDGDGYGPIELSSNVAGAVDATTSVLNGNNSTGQKIVGGVSGVYKMIPFYATDKTKKPEKGGYILGKADIAPNFKICYMQHTNKKGNSVKIPYPVRKTSYYSVSGEKKSTGASQSGTPGYSTDTSNGTINYE